MLTIPINSNCSKVVFVAVASPISARLVWSDNRVSDSSKILFGRGYSIARLGRATNVCSDVLWTRDRAIRALISEIAHFF